jgi:hypothetical protein
MEMLNLKDFEGWIYCMERGHDPSKGGQDTSVDRLAAVSQTVGSFFGPIYLLAYEKGLSITPVSCIIWSIFQLQNWHTPFWNP